MRGRRANRRSVRLVFRAFMPTFLGTAEQKSSGFGVRIARAEELAQANPPAAELLRAYARIVGFQKSLYKFLEDCSFTAAAAQGLPELEWYLLVPHFQSFLQMAALAGAEGMQQAARSLEQQGAPAWQQLLSKHWQQDAPVEDAGDLFARAFLQPVAQYLAERADFPKKDYSGRLCPFCGRKPVVAVLRPEGDGGKRWLVCSLCSTEWEYLRILCAGCDEGHKDNLPVYLAEELPSARIEACDTCKQYIKAIDLTKNGLAVPVVDELGTASLNLWAEEKGYRKVQPNIFGL
jgi:FdhE protein